MDRETSLLLRIHEINKSYLNRLNLEHSKYHNVQVLDRYKENLLLEYIKESQNTRYFYKYIRVKDSSTGNFVFLSVPNEMRSCKTAIAWTFGLSVKEYELFFET